MLGFKLHYRETREPARPWFCFTGSAAMGSSWAPTIVPLARSFHVIALDQIGFGQSDKPLANYHTGMLSEFLAEVSIRGRGL